MKNKFVFFIILSVLSGLALIPCAAKGALGAGEVYHYDYRFSDDANIVNPNSIILNNTGGAFIQNQTGGILFTGETRIVNGARMIHNYAFAADSGEEIVFDITFSGYFADDQARAADLYVGVAFGLNGNTAAFDAGATGFVGIRNLDTAVFLGGIEKGRQGSYPQYAEAYNERITMRIVGKKNGTLDVYRGYSFGEAPEDITKKAGTYGGFTTEGKIAFGVYNRAGYANYRFIMTDYSVQGSVSAAGITPSAEIEIDEKHFPYATIGMDPLQLKANVRTPITEFKGITFSASGDCAIDTQNRLIINGPGQITVRAQSDVSSDFDEAWFTPKSPDALSYEKYSAEDKFFEKNYQIWDFIDSKNRVFASDTGLTFLKDYIQGSYEGARVVSNTKFTSLGGDIVFDVSFLSYWTTRSQNNIWGLAFGLSEKTSSIVAPDTGFFWFAPAIMGLKVGGRNVEPVYLNKSLGASVYADYYGQAYSVRLVGKKDGTLEFYRMQAGNESIGTLKARYENINFDGYIALTTYCDNSNSESAVFGASFNDFKITGTGIDFKTTAISKVEIDKAPFIDIAQVSRPLKLQAFVSAFPSFDKYFEVDWFVVGGPAQISGGYISFSAPGSVTLKAISKVDPSKSETYTFQVYDYSISKLTIKRELFANVTNFTQPIALAADIESSLNLPKYAAVSWEVISGPVRIINSKLRITGIGTAVLKATADYDTSKTDTVTFEIKNYYEELDKKNNSSEKGCASAAIGGDGGKAALIISFFLLLAAASVSVRHLINKMTGLLTLEINSQA